MNKKNIIVFDFETSSVDHRIADIFQIAALAVDGLKLEVIPNSYFNAWMKPDGFDEPGYYEKFKSTIDWHAKNFNCTPNDFMEKIKNSPPEKLVWEQFTKYLSNYHDRQNNQSFHSSPIPAGFNIINYDMRILERFCTKYKNVQKDGSQSLFYMRDVRDVLHMASLWLSPLNELKGFSMDVLRPYFGLETSGAHEAKKDVEDITRLLLKFMNMHQLLAKKVTFKGSCA